jgi:hypothetical protein
LNRLFGVRPIEEFDEREASRSTRFTVDRQHDV